MKLISAFLVLLVASLLPSKVHPQETCDQRGYVIGFFNGVFTTTTVAHLGLLELQRANNITSFKGQNVSFDLFYNPTDGHLEDVAEAFKQLEQRYPDELGGRYEILLQHILGIALAPLFPLPSDIENDIKLALTYHARLALFETAPEPVVLRLANQVQDHILDKRKVLAVAHSQGNLFLNAVYAKLQPNLSSQNLDVFRTVHIAPPDVTPGPHTTNLYDVVIEAVRLSVGTPPPWNVKVLPGLVSGNLALTGHYFVEDYLRANSEALANILADINRQLELLEDFPCEPPLPGCGVSLPVPLPSSSLLGVNIPSFPIALSADGCTIYYSTYTDTAKYEYRLMNVKTGGDILVLPQSSGKAVMNGMNATADKFVFNFGTIINGGVRLFDLNSRSITQLPSQMNTAKAITADGISIFGTQTQTDFSVTFQAYDVSRLVVDCISCGTNIDTYAQLIATSGNGRYVVVVVDGGLRRLDRLTGVTDIVYRRTQDEWLLSNFDISPDGRYIAYNYATFYELLGPPFSVASANFYIWDAITQTSRYLGSCENCSGKTVDQTEIAWGGHGEFVTSVKVSSDGSHVAFLQSTYQQKQQLRVQNIATGATSTPYSPVKVDGIVGVGAGGKSVLIVTGDGVPQDYRTRGYLLFAP